jgi:hypothetical protein
MPTVNALDESTWHDTVTRRGDRRLHLEARDERDHLGSLRLAGDRLYVGNLEGSMIVLRAGRRTPTQAQPQAAQDGVG